ncbi:hypothetical protein KZZ52_48575 [Dactylosporangium sp. AC04546]|nr:hypothetical protein [Dactylosporangium sp. AC04546]WVK81748.1 hypothetical protein KZZ52_48575 [Dactylosporangium sp. AC04546]
MPRGPDRYGEAGHRAAGADHHRETGHRAELTTTAGTATDPARAGQPPLG